MCTKRKIEEMMESNHNLSLYQFMELCKDKGYRLKVKPIKEKSNGKI